TTVPNTSNTRAFTSGIWLICLSFHSAPASFVVARSTCDEAIQHLSTARTGLLRFARNDGGYSTFLYWMNPRLSATLSYSARACALLDCVSQYTRLAPAASALR